MLNNNPELLTRLRILGLKQDQSKVYLSLLDSPKSHLELARKTGVNRTKVYRIADVLISKGLITLIQDDRGKRLAANDPANLEIALTTAEDRIKKQRTTIEHTLPILQSLYKQIGQNDPSNFIVNTYEGIDGFKQMLWNELKTKKEVLIFGHGSIEDLTNNRNWSEKHRAKTIESGYIVREINNPRGKQKVFTKNKEFVEKAYTRRDIDPKILPIQQQMAIYNDTVNIYNWIAGRKVGLEIINPAFADMQRATFEHFWKIAKPVN